MSGDTFCTFLILFLRKPSVLPGRTYILYIVRQKRYKPKQLANGNICHDNFCDIFNGQAFVGICFKFRSQHDTEEFTKALLHWDSFIALRQFLSEEYGDRRVKTQLTNKKLNKDASEYTRKKTTTYSLGILLRHKWEIAC